jgi:Protein of unknown function (DUF3761)
MTRVAMRRTVVTVLAVALGAGLVATPSMARSSDAWLATRGTAQQDLRARFHNIAGVACAPDRTSASKVIGTDRYWQRFWCGGHTYDRIAFRLRYKSTGRCAECWTITNLSGTSAGHLRSRPTQRASGSPSGSCPSGYYRNSSGHCIHRPSNDPAGATALCVDGTYSYSEHASGTCSHHGGVARWINHP